MFAQTEINALIERLKSETKATVNKLQEKEQTMTDMKRKIIEINKTQAEDVRNYTKTINGLRSDKEDLETKLQKTRQKCGELQCEVQDLEKSLMSSLDCTSCSKLENRITELEEKETKLTEERDEFKKRCSRLFSRSTTCEKDVDFVLNCLEEADKTYRRQINESKQEIITKRVDNRFIHSKDIHFKPDECINIETESKLFLNRGIDKMDALKDHQRILRENVADMKCIHKLMFSMHNQLEAVTSEKDDILEKSNQDLEKYETIMKKLKSIILVLERKLEASSQEQEASTFKYRNQLSSSNDMIDFLKGKVKDLENSVGTVVNERDNLRIQLQKANDQTDELGKVKYERDQVISERNEQFRKNKAILEQLKEIVNKNQK